MKSRYGIITQGSVLNNFRVEQFPGFQFYAVVITARCDIANCKVSKFYYLKAAPVDVWIKTEGLRLALEKIYNKKLKEVLKYWEDILPEYNELFGKPLDYIKSIVSNVKPIEGESVSDCESSKRKTIEALCQLDKYTLTQISPEESCKLVEEQEIVSIIKSTVGHIFEEKHTHYCFLPYISYERYSDKADESSKYSEYYNEGLIINLLDIDYLDYNTAVKIERQELDYKKLGEDELRSFRKIFYLENSEDIIFPEDTIGSPYIEWVMQQFSQAFIRIGIDKPYHKDILDYWNKKFTSK